MFSIHTCNFGVNDVQLIGQCLLFIYHQSIEKKDLTVVTQMLVAFELGLSRNFSCASGRFPGRTIKHCFLVGVNDSLFSTTIWQTAAPNDLCCQNKAENNRHKGTKRRQTHTQTHTHTSIYIYIYIW